LVLNIVNRFNRRDTHFRQPWIDRKNWHLQFGDGGGVPKHKGRSRLYHFWGLLMFRSLSRPSQSFGLLYHL